MNHRAPAALVFVLWAASGAADSAQRDKRSPIDRLIEESQRAGTVQQPLSPGSLWVPNARLSDVGADFRASRPGDIVTVVVEERASAIARGKVQSSRTSAVKSGIGAAGGLTRAAGPLAQLANAGSQSKLDGEGATSRATELSTTLAARVTHVVANGLLVIEGSKIIAVNSDSQLVSIRGLVRPVDLSTGNVVLSDRVAELEVTINGKGIVNDSIRRPFFLYRLLLGLLPF